MKRIILALSVCAFMEIAAWADEIPSVQSFGSGQADRVSNSTGLFDYWSVTPKSTRLMSLFGYNNGSAGFVEVFNTVSTNPVINISGFDSVSGAYTSNVPNILATGDAIQLTNTLGGNAAAIYWVNIITTNAFFLNSTHAKAIALTGDKLASGGSASGNANLVPIHSFKIAGTDNFSCIVPTTGINCGRGLLIATSTTAGTYTYGGTNITSCVTIGSP